MKLALTASFALTAVLTAGPAVPASALGSACPASDAVCQSGDDYGQTTNTTTNPTFNWLCSGPVKNVEIASFDIPAGRFEVATGEGGGMDLMLRDWFTISGPAPGTAIALHMRVRVHGGLNWDGACCPDSQARVDLSPLEPAPGDPESHWSFGKTSGPFQSYPFSDSLDFTLQRTAGAAIGIEIRASTHMDAPSSSDLVGEFYFPDLPQGWTVSSCKGYLKQQPVSATVASWGRVKAAYR